MTYTENPLPQVGAQHPVRRYAKVMPFDINDALRLREQFRSEATERDGVLCWNSNGRAVPPDIFRDAFCTPSPSHLAGYAKQADEFISAYKERMKNHVPSDEELFEMRAAFGPGATVVNAITGQKIHL